MGQKCPKMGKNAQNGAKMGKNAPKLAFFGLKMAKKVYIYIYIYISIHSRHMLGEGATAPPQAYMYYMCKYIYFFL